MGAKCTGLKLLFQKKNLNIFGLNVKTVKET